MGPLQFLMENMSLATLLAISPPGVCCQGGIYPHNFPSNYSNGTCTLLRDQTMTPFTPKVASSPWPGEEATGTPEEPPHQKQKAWMPLKKSLKGSQWEAFTKDSDLMQQAREAYFRANCPCFNHETSCDLTGLFWEMAASAGLLDSKILRSKRPGLGRRT